MRVFITSIAELSQNFFNSDPLKFNQYFAITPDYQKYCLGANLPTHFTITLAKEAMLIHDIAIHLLAGGYKLTTGTVKGICAIASGILGLETDHQTPSKQAAVHFGFACVYAADIFVSITNINNTYPQHLIDKIKNVFVNFLEVPSKEITIEYIVDPEIEKALKKKQAEAEEKELALQEEQRKAKEQEELLKKTQQELEDTRNSDFFSEKELQELFTEVPKVADTATYEEDHIKKELKVTTTSFIIDNKKLRTDPSQYMLTYTNGIDSDDDTDLLSQEDLWFEDEFSENETVVKKQKEQLLKEEKKSIEEFPLKNPKTLETKKITSLKKVSRRPKKKTSSNNNLSQISARARRLEYSEEIRSHSKKTLAS